MVLRKRKTSRSIGRRPRVLLHLNDADEQAAWRDYLEKNRCIVYPMIPAVAKEGVVQYLRIDAVLCDGAIVDARIAKGVPYEVLAVGLLPLGAEPAGFFFEGGRCAKVFDAGVDPRQIVAAVYGAAWGRVDEKFIPVDVDQDLSMVWELNLVFWRNRPMRLERAERQILVALMRAPGRVFGWAEIMEMCGCSRQTAYTSVKKIRDALRKCGAEIDYIQTIAGTGLVFGAL